MCALTIMRLGDEETYADDTFGRISKPNASLPARWLCRILACRYSNSSRRIADLRTRASSNTSAPSTNVYIGMSYLMNTAEDNFLPKRRRTTHSEMTRLLPDLPTSTSSTRFVIAQPLAHCFLCLTRLLQLRTLWLMTQLVMMFPEKIRPNMDEQKVDDQTGWRIEPYGWDRDDREYYVLDDNRLYRLTQPPLAPAPPKKTSQKAKAAARAAKRRRVSAEEASDADAENDDASQKSKEEDPLGGATWECIAITTEEIHKFLETISKTKDENEKVLRKQITGYLLPIVEGHEASRKRKMLQREKELLNMEKLAHAKRSSRLANKQDHQRQEEIARQEEQKRYAEEVAARKEEQLRKKIEKERDNRMMSREQRLREREARRIQHEEELAQLSESSKQYEAGRMSERRVKAEIEKNKQALKELEEEEDEWEFDCVCGLHGQVDDGEHSVACERCNVWQHSKCLGIKEAEAERDDFHFICRHCREEEKKKQERPTPKIKIKVKHQSSVPSTKPKPVSTTPIPLPRLPGMSPNLFIEMKAKPASLNGPSKLNGGVSLPSVPGASQHPEPSPQKLASSSPTGLGSNGVDSRPSETGTTQPLWAFPPRRESVGGQGHNPFSSPHPNLSPPDQSPNKSRAYGSIFNPSSPISKTGHDGIDTGSNHIAKDQPYFAPTTTNGTVGQRPTSPTKETAPPTVTSPQKSSHTPRNSVTNGMMLDHQDSPSASKMMTPRLNPSQNPARFEDKSQSPLIPSSPGLSPTKHSPTARSTIRSSPVPAILPPVAALSPSPSQQDPTPPIKHAEPTRPTSQDG